MQARFHGVMTGTGVVGAILALTYAVVFDQPSGWLWLAGFMVLPLLAIWGDRHVGPVFGDEDDAEPCGKRMRSKADGGLLLMSDGDWPTCELPRGHGGAHRDGAMHWMDVDASDGTWRARP